MIDRTGRKIEYLRISLTPDCNLNCIYCNSNNKASDSKDVLSPDELKQIVQSMAKLGISKVRLTGGEPLLRSDVCEIASAISSVPGLDDISLTTNGILLKQLAEKLKKSGVNRINVSLDSLDRKVFSSITGGGELDDVLQGIDSAAAAGLLPIKVNVVLIKDINSNEICDFIELTRDRDIEVRFIELMPIGDFGETNQDKSVSNADIIASLPMLTPVRNTSKGPSQLFRLDGYKGVVGFISPISHRFCHQCNRIRLTHDGIIKPCLGTNDEFDVAYVLRNSPEKLDGFIEDIIFNKPAGHCFESDFHSSRDMNRIGG